MENFKTMNVKYFFILLMGMLLLTNLVDAQTASFTGSNPSSEKPWDGFYGVYQRTPLTVTLTVEYDVATFPTATYSIRQVDGDAGLTFSTTSPNPSTGNAMNGVAPAKGSLLFKWDAPQNNSTVVKTYTVEFIYEASPGVKVKKSFLIVQKSSAPYIQSVTLGGGYALSPGTYYFKKGQTIPIRVIYSESGMIFNAPNLAIAYVTVSGNTMPLSSANTTPGGTVFATQSVDFNFTIPSGFEAKSTPLTFGEIETTSYPIPFSAQKPLLTFARNILEPGISTNLKESGFIVYIDGVEPTVSVSALVNPTTNAYGNTVDLFSTESSNKFFLINKEFADSPTGQTQFSTVNISLANLDNYCLWNPDKGRSAVATSTLTYNATLNVSELYIKSGRASEEYYAYAVDTYGNVSTNVKVLTVNDGIKPWITYGLTGSAGSVDVPGRGPTYGAAGITVTATFSEVVRPAPSIGFVIGGGTASTATVSSFPSTLSTTYVYTVKPNANGIVSLDLNTSSYSDVFGNEGTNGKNAPSLGYKRYSAWYDSTSPTASVYLKDYSLYNVTSKTVIPIYVDFGEPMPNFTAIGVTIASANNAPTCVDGFGNTMVYGNAVDANKQIFSFNVSPSILKTRSIISIEVNASTKTDFVGNQAINGYYTFEYNGVVPTPTLSILNASGAVGNPLFNYNTSNYTNVLPKMGLVFDYAVESTTIPPFINNALSITSGSVIEKVGINYIVGNPSGDSKTYSFNVTTALEGGITVAVPSTNRIQSSPNIYASTFSNPATVSFVYDITKPVPSIIMQGGVWYNGGLIYKKTGLGATSIGFIVSFNESVYSLSAEAGDVTVTSPYAAITNSSVTGTGNFGDKVNGIVNIDENNVPFTGANTVIGLDLGASVVYDRAGNVNNALASKITITYDPVPPVPVITSPTIVYGSLNGPIDGPFNFVVNFGEEVVGFNTSQVALTNATFSSPATLIDQANGIYGFTVIPDASTSAGTNDVFVAIYTPAITDIAGNVMSWGGNGTSTYSFQYDNRQPKVIDISSPDVTDGATTLGTNFNFTVTFDELVHVLANPLVVSTPLGGLAVPYTVTYTPAVLIGGDFSVYNLNINITTPVVGKAGFTISVPAVPVGVEDGVQNPNQAGKSFYFEYDGILPIPTIKSDSWQTLNGTTPISSTTIPVVINFGSVIDPATLDATDITVTYLDKNNTVLNSSFITTGTWDPYNRVYSFDVANSNINTTIISVNIAPGTVVNSVGNINVAATAQYGSSYVLASALTILCDRIGPIPTLSTLDVANNGHTNVTTYYFTVNVGEDLTTAPTFDLSKVIVTGTAPIASAVTVNNTNSGIYEFYITLPNGSGHVEVELLKNSIYDIAGNGASHGDDNWIWDYDTTVPEPTILYHAAGLSLTTSTPSTTQYTNNPFGVVVDFGEKMNAFGTVEVKFASKGNTSFSTLTAPTYLTANNTIGLYSFSISGANEGTYEISVVANEGTNQYGTQSAVSLKTLSVYYDGLAPIPTITTSGTLYSAAGYNYTNQNPIVTVNFGEPVDGFSLSDVGLINATFASAYTDLGNGAYSFVLKPDLSLCIIKIAVKDKAVMDKAGNESSTSTGLPLFPFPSEDKLVTYDAVSPIPEISVYDPTGAGSIYLTNPTNRNPIIFQVAFNQTDPTGFKSGEEVVGYDDNISGDITIATSGTLPSSFTPNLVAVDQYAGIYTFEYTGFNPQSDVISIAIKNLAATDIAGNSSSASATFTFVWDNRGPLATINPSIAPTVLNNGATNQTNLNFFVDFGGREMQGTILPIFVDNTTVAAVQPQSPNGVYSFTTSPLLEGLVTMSVTYDAARDMAGNACSASAAYSFIYDTTPVDVAFIIPSFVNTASVFSFNATDPKTTPSGFTYVNYTIAGATATTFVLSQGNVSADPVDAVLGGSALSEGVYTVTYNAYDVAGNVATGTRIFTFDTTAPLVDFSTTKTFPGIPNATVNTGTPHIYVQFSELVTGFTSDDILLSIQSAPATANDAWGIFSFSTEVKDLGNGLYDVQLDSKLFPTLTTIPMTISILTGSLTDLAGNNIVTPPSYNFIYDTTNPRPTISLFDADYTSTFAYKSTISTNASPLRFIVDFKKTLNPSDDLIDTDITVTFNGVPTTVDNFAYDTNNSYYTFEVSPNLDGTLVKVDIAPGVVSDIVGNPSLDVQSKDFHGVVTAGAFSIVYDINPPVLTLSTRNDGLVYHTSDNPLIFTANFNEDVTDFDESKVYITNASGLDITTDFAITGNPVSPAVTGVFTFTLTASTPFNYDYINVNVAADAAKDIAGNGNIATTFPVQIWWDTTQPNPTITVNGRLQNETNNPDKIFYINTPVADVKVAFGEPVHFDDATAVGVTNFVELTDDGVSAVFDNTTWLAKTPDYVHGNFIYDINPSTLVPQGIVTINIADAAAYDYVVLGTPNYSTASNFTFVYDFVQPQPTIYTNFDIARTSPENTTSLGSKDVKAWVDFGEKVIGFNTGDIKVVLSSVTNAINANGVITPTVSVTTLGVPGAWDDNKRVYSFTIVPNEFEGMISIEIEANAASDWATNGSLPSVAAYDFSSPTYTIYYDGVRPFPSFSFLNPSNQAKYELNMPLNAYDVPAAIVVDFGEEVHFMDASYITIQNCSMSGFEEIYDAKGYNVYSFYVTPTEEGVILSLNIDENKVVDNTYDLLNNNYPNAFNFKYEGLHPYAFFAADANKYPVGVTEFEYYTNKSVVPMTASFQEKTIGFESTDILLDGATFPVTSMGSYSFTNVIVNGNYVANFNFLVGDEGVYSFTVPAGAFQDINGNLNTNSYPRPMVIHYDVTRPVPTFTPNIPNVLTTNKNPFIVNLNFGEIVTGLLDNEIVITNGGNTLLPKNLLPINNGKSYQFEVTPTTDGLVVISIASGVASDLAGNACSNASITILFDTTAPKPSFVTNANWSNLGTVTTGIAHTNVMPNFLVDLYFVDVNKGNTTEKVDFLDNTEFVTNFGSLATFGAANTGLYNFTFTPTVADGTLVTLEVKSAVVTDEAGNANVSGTYQFYYDNVLPVISSITNTGYEALNNPGYVNGKKLDLPFEIKFSEKVSGFDSNDITVSVNGAIVNSQSVIVTNPNTFASSFVFTLSGSMPDGTVTIDVKGNVVSDYANNWNVSTATYKFVYDNTRPEATMSCAQGSVNPNNNSRYTNAKPDDAIVIAADFGEVVDGVNLMYVSATTTVGAKSVKYVTATLNPDADVQASVYSFDITNLLANLPTAQAGSIVTVTMDYKSDTKCATFDLAGNPNKPSTFTIAYDVVAPAPTVIGIVKQYPNTTGSTSAPLTIVVDMKEAVFGFLNTDLLVTNTGSALAQPVTISGVDGFSVYTFEVTPTTDGLITVSVPANVATDYALNENVVSNYFTINYDTKSPVPTISGTLGNNFGGVNYTNKPSIILTVNFNEPVYEFVGNEFTVNNGLINTGDLSPVYPLGDGSTQFTTTLTFNPSAIAGTIATASIDANVDIFDAAYNNNAASNVYSIVYDGVAPSPVIAISPISGDAYNTVDGVKHSIPVTVTVTFDEKVIGLTTLTLSSGTAVLSSGDAVNGSSVYVFTVNGATSEEQLNVDVLAGAASDYAGNGCKAATQQSIYYDSTHPTVTITSVTGNYQGKQNAISLELAFSEPVKELTGFGKLNHNDVTINVYLASGAVHNVSGGIGGWGTIAGIDKVSNTVYTFTVTPASGHLDVVTKIVFDFAANTTSDNFGNGNAPAATLTVIYDAVDPIPTVSPVVTLTANGGSNTKDAPVVFDVNFGETIKNFDTTTLVVVGGTPVVSTTDNIHFSVQVYAPIVNPNSVVSVSVPALSAADLAGNTNKVAATASVIYDGINPTPVISPLVNTPSNLSSIPATVDFGEAVVGFTSDKITVSSNATVSDLLDLGKGKFSFNLVPTADGIVTASIAASVVTDLASNPNIGAAQYSIASDRTNPTVTISTTWVNPSDNKAIGANVPVYLNFNEAVTGFAAGQVDVRGAGVLISSINSVAGSQSQYSFNVATVGKVGTFTVDVYAAAATDKSGNLNAKAQTFTFTFDGQGPIPAISVSPTATNANPFTVKVNFGEKVDVAGKEPFEIGDVVVKRSDNGTRLDASQVSGFGKVSDGIYTFVITMKGGEETDVNVSIAESVCQDVFGNWNTGADYTFRFDQKAPIVTISAERAEVEAGRQTNILPIVARIKFNEAISTFNSANVSVTVAGVAASSVKFEQAGADYLVTINDANLPSNKKVIIIDAAAGTASDLAGNGSARVTYSLTFDGTRPTPTITLNPDKLTNAPYIAVTVNFGKKVKAFDAQSAQCLLSSGQVASLSTARAEEGFYTFQVAPDFKQGTFTVTIPYGVVSDFVGNTNDIGFAQVAYDAVKPQPTITNVVADGKNQFITATIIFNESVESANPFIASNITVSNNGTISAFKYAGNYRGIEMYDVTATGMLEGQVAISIAANQFADLAKNLNIAAEPKVTEYRITGPRLEILSPLPVSGKTIPISASTVFNYANPDGTLVPYPVLVLNGIEYPVMKQGATLGEIFGSSFALLTDGILTLRGQNAAGLIGTASISVTVDKTAPVVDITSPSENAIVAADAVINFTVTPIEDIANPIKIELTILNGETYTKDITSTISSVAVMLKDLAGYSKLAVGDLFTVKVIVADLAGNVGSDIVNLQYNSVVARPVVTVLTKEVLTNRANVAATLQSSAVGYVYILQDGSTVTEGATLALTLAELDKAVAQKVASKAIVNAAGKDVSVLTEGLPVGIYRAYAIDLTGRLSNNTTDPVVIIEGNKPVGSIKFVTSLNVAYFEGSIPNGGEVRWDFGDGTSATFDQNDLNPTHTYKAVGDYTVRLFVTNDFGTDVEVDSKKVTIAVIPTQTDVKDAQSKVAVNVYPNPCVEKFTYSYENSVNVDKATLTIFDINGKVILVDKISVNGKSFIKDYNVSAYSKGTYLIQVEANGAVETKRLVIR